jgi:hypothetical protein
MGMKRDTYQMWKDTGQLPQVLEFIKECSRKLVTQKEMCTYLNLDEATFTRLKKKHPELDEAFHKAKLDLKKDLMGALYKKAIGYELVEEEQFIEDKGKGEQQKRKIHRTKKQVGPDYKAIVYLLNKHFGREFNERYDDFEILKEKQALLKEEWNDGSQEVECDTDES